MTPLATSLLKTLVARGAISASDLLAIRVEALDAAVSELRDMGVTMHQAPSGEMVALESLDLLDESLIGQRLAKDPVLPVRHLRVEWQTASTNTLVMDAPEPAPDTCHVVLAEHQSDGQGRRGSPWLSPFASGLCMSVAFRLDSATDISRLPLALGLGLRRALLEHGVESCHIKWPNDLIADGRKLGGLLVSARQIPDAPMLMVAGVGINVYSVPPLTSTHALAPASLADCISMDHLSRSALAASLINALRHSIDLYGRGGFAEFENDWDAADFLRDRAVHVFDSLTASKGVARGIDRHGHLLVETETGMVPVHSGAVSVRPSEQI